jgi:hypothetical protein
MCSRHLIALAPSFSDQRRQAVGKYAFVAVSLSLGTATYIDPK